MAISTIEAIWVMIPRSNEIPTISITILDRITAVSGVPRIFPIKSIGEFSNLLTIFAGLKK